MESRTTLTELEGSVLGVVQGLEPCTAYVVRRVFLDSPSPYWSGSAGAIYPLIERLRRQGFLRARPSTTGRRKSRLNSLTPAGLAALRLWLRPPLPDVVIGVPADPLRTRLGFLRAISAGERRTLLTDAARRMAVHRRAIEADVVRKRRTGDLYDVLVALGARAAIRAREAWLDEVIRAFAKQERGRSSIAPVRRGADTP
jgi:DNA-binding PadR family transcriptional regulator